VLVGAGFAGSLAILLGLEERGHNVKRLAVFGGLGEMSYTLYVVHFPVLFLMSGALMARTGGLLPQHFGWVAAGSAICLALAWALHLVVERPFVSR
jgi:peptidoglycan/LPS O-acetylase OafA/YrhL